MAEHPHHPPDEVGEQHGLAYARFRPPTAVRGGIVVLHGAGSCKESHFDFAHAAREAGFEAIAFDARGHGASGGRLDGRAIDDVVAIASLLPRPLALRGSSMGGYFALVSARVAGAGAVVAVCPASGGGLLRGLDAGRLTFTADRAALGDLFARNHILDAVRTLAAPLLVQHAEDDEVVPLAHSEALVAAAGSAVARLTVAPGGDHRSVQHDPARQQEALAFVREALATASA